ncbi:MAG: protein-disulfide reductase DsbD domain-containing protein [Pseudomonadota bacterium]
MIKTLLTSLALATALSVSADAQSSTPMARLDVLPGWRTESGTQMTGFLITMRPGWKTYWRTPGDAGIPPRFDWRGSENLKGVALHWPRPDVFFDYGMRTVGFKDQLLLPVELAPRGEGPIRVAGTLEVGVCEDVCVPVQLDYNRLVEPGGAKDPAILAALRDRPVSGQSAGVTRAICSVAPISDGLRVTAQIDLPLQGSTEYAIMELTDPSVWVSEAALERSSGTVTVVADMVPADAQPFALARSDVTVTVLTEGKAVEVKGCAGS